MKTITIEETVYYHTTIQDAIIALPLMDYLQSQVLKKKDYELFQTLPQEEKCLYFPPTPPEIANVEKMYNIMLSLGFAPSTDIPLEGSKERLEHQLNK